MIYGELCGNNIVEPSLAKLQQCFVWLQFIVSLPSHCLEADTLGLQLIAYTTEIIHG
jgi:hypothetical protein